MVRLKTQRVQVLDPHLRPGSLDLTMALNCVVAPS